MMTATLAPNTKADRLDNQFDAREYYATNERILITTPDNSCAGLNIFVGDELIVVDKPCKSGDIVVVKINGEFTPRRFIWNDYQNQIELHEFGYGKPPIVVGEANILGVVVGVLWSDRDLTC